MTNGYNTPIGVPIGLPSILSLGLPPLINPYPTLNLDFIENSQFDSRITFSRGSQATLFNSTGALVYAKHNLLLRSQELATSPWFNANLTSIANNTTDLPAPNESNTATKVVVSGTAGAVGQTATLTPTSYVGSIWLRSSSGTATADLIVYLSAAPFTLIGIQTITITTTWQRFSVVTSTATAAAYNFQVNNITAGATVYLWGAQLNIANMEGGVTSSLSTYYPTTTAAYYAPRFDYNPSTLAAQGLLIEEQRTNLLPRSEEFSDASWTKSGATVTADSTTAPSGTATADTLIEDTSTGQHRVYRTVSGTTNTNPYTYSIFAKASTRTRIYIGIAEGTTFVRQGNAIFDLSTGTIVSFSTGGGGATGGSATIQNVGNGWYRCTYTVTLGGTDTNIFVDNNIVSTGTTINYTGNGTGSLFIWGAQLEAGAFATSYIPTTTTALTRNADVASMTGTNFSSWYNQTEGTLLAQGILEGGTSGTFPYQVSAVGSNANTDLIGITWAAPSSNIRGVIRVSASATMDQSAGVAKVAGNSFRAAIAYELNNGNFAVDGSIGANDTSMTLPTVQSLLIGGVAGFQPTASSWIQRISYYPVRLPNSTLQALTA